MILFETFKKMLSLLAADEQTTSRNAVMQDSDYADAIQNHITALTADQNLRLNTTNAVTTSTLGLMVVDTNTRELRFEPSGSEKIAQGYLEANIGNVTKIWQRSDDSLGTSTGTIYGTLSDGRRYYVTDTTRGVFYLNEYGQIIGSVPGYSATVGSGYGIPVSAITFTTTGGTEYIAIVSAISHFLRIYDTATFTLVATFGTAGSPGLADVGLLNTPTDLAFDEATDTLFVSCSADTPAGAVGPGWVASFDCSALPAITFSEYVVQNNGLALDQLSCVSPEGLFFDPTLSSLWVLSVDTSNATRPVEVGAISITTGLSDGYLKGYLEFQGAGFTTSNTTSKIHVDNDRRRLYLTNSPGVETFDLETMKHVRTFGFYGQDETSDNPNSGSLTPATGQVQAVCSDILSVDSVQNNLLIFNDITNNRLVRVSENMYDGENSVLFEAMEFVVPVSLHGYLVKGDVSSSKVVVQYRTSATGVWQRLSQTDTVPASDYFQFQLLVTADLGDVIASRSISEIIVIGEQE
jgi:hypothetical protein